MKQNKCPVLRRVGLPRSIVGLVQRFFKVRFQLPKKTEIIEKHKHQEPTLGSSGYHLSFRQVKKIFNVCSNIRDRVMIQTFIYTGMRRAEAAVLAVEDIDWDDNLLLVREGKGNKQRLIPITQELSIHLKNLIGERLSGPVFQNKYGKQLSVRQVNRIVANAGKMAGIENPNPKHENITCHLFRHTFARLWKAQQGSIESLSAILGHKSVSTTWDIYGKESMEDIQQNYNKTIGQMYKNPK